jgi:hypothetical protein
MGQFLAGPLWDRQKGVATTPFQMLAALLARPKNPNSVLLIKRELGENVAAAIAAAFGAESAPSEPEQAKSLAAKDFEPNSPGSNSVN